VNLCRFDEIQTPTIRDGSYGFTDTNATGRAHFSIVSVFSVDGKTRYLTAA
jgi:hypothetical protein